MSENNLPEPELTPASTPVESSLPVPAPYTPSTPPPAAPPPSGYTSGSRPAGITILAIVSFISGVVGLCCSSPFLLVLSLIGVVIPSGVTQILGLVGIVLACLLAIGPLLQIAFAYGAWNLRPWGWWLGIAAMLISLAGVLVNTLGSGGTMVWTFLTNGLLPLVILIYLLLPNTRKAFNM